MIKINGINKLVVNSDRHTVKTTNEFKVLPYQAILECFLDQGFTFIDYNEQGYYNRSKRKNRHGKGLFRLDLVSPVHPWIGLCISSANDNQMALYVHATIKGIPVKQLNKIRHIEAEMVEIDFQDILNNLKALCNKIVAMVSTEVSSDQVIQSFQEVNSYRAGIITNSLSFVPVRSVNQWELLTNLFDSMINGLGIPEYKSTTGRTTRAIVQIRKRFLLGSKILEIVTR